MFRNGLLLIYYKGLYQAVLQCRPLLRRLRRPSKNITIPSSPFFASYLQNTISSRRILKSRCVQCIIHPGPYMSEGYALPILTVYCRLRSTTKTRKSWERVRSRLSRRQPKKLVGRRCVTYSICILVSSSFCLPGYGWVSVWAPECGQLGDGMLAVRPRLEGRSRENGNLAVLPRRARTSCAPSFNAYGCSHPLS